MKRKYRINKGKLIRNVVLLAILAALTIGFMRDGLNTLDQAWKYEHARVHYPTTFIY